MPRASSTATPSSRMADVAAPLRRWSYASVSDKIADIVLGRGRSWALVVAFLISMIGTVAFVGAIGWLFLRGIGIWGVNIPTAWGFAIANFVWWIGIGHAGTFISAILLLLRQTWRTSINRFAEAMTLFAAGIAGIFPILHLGRPWFFYWLVPYPNVMELWPQWRSALVWDIFAISTYLIVSLLFWYIGLVPALAPVPAGVAARLVVWLHSVGSPDFAIAIVPGYHSTVFPPYFVAGALFSGFAMVLTLAIPLRHFFRLHDFITDRHLENAAKILLACGWIVAYGYFIETFTAFYSGDEFEIAMVKDRLLGFYGPVYWTVLACNIVVPQILWWRAARRSAWTLLAVSLVVNLGMWLERVMIVVQSMHHDFMPSAWGNFIPTAWDWITFFGSIAFFAFLFLLFVRALPAISIFEMRELVLEEKKS